MQVSYSASAYYVPVWTEGKHRTVTYLPKYKISVCKNISKITTQLHLLYSLRLFHLYSNHQSLWNEKNDKSEYMPKQTADSLWTHQQLEVHWFSLFITSENECNLSQIPHPDNLFLCIAFYISVGATFVCFRNISFSINWIYVNRKQTAALPEPQTTNMKSASNPGPTGYLSSRGFCNTIKIN
jgi:hypothetical protein